MLGTSRSEIHHSSALTDTCAGARADARTECTWHAAVVSLEGEKLEHEVRRMEYLCFFVVALAGFSLLFV